MTTLPPGTRLGPYELTTLLGAGGMGEVYRARDTRLDRQVAVKVLPRHFAADPERRARLEREARAISSLSHPNVCALYDVGHQEGTDYLVMEYLEGEPLDRRLRKGPLPLEQLVRIGVEIASALERAHRQGIVHRDLKPANVMLTRSGAKLLDFGIAKPLGAAGRPLAQPTVAAGQPSPTPLTSVGAVIGTLEYMAPEQLEGREVDARTDIFALGAVLYEMATGRRAFEGGSPASLIAAVLEKQPPPIGAAQPASPPALDRLVRLCLAKDPDERWQAAHDVRLELEGLAEQVAPVAHSATASRRLRRERLAWAAAVAVLLAAAGWLLAARGAPRATSGPLRLSLLPPPGVTGTGPLALSPDGNQVAFVAYAADGVPHLFVRALGGEAERLPGTEDASLPFWSPDGRSLGFFAQRRLKRIELGGGPPRVLAEITDARGGSWGPEGTIVFGPNPGDGLYRVSAEGGAPEPFTRLDPQRGDSSHRWPTLLPDGKHVVFLALSSERERLTLRVASAADPHGRPLVAADSGAVYTAPGWLLFTRGQTLLAQRFDADTLELTGEPEAIAEGIWRDPDVDGLRAFSAAGRDVIAYRPGGSDLTRLLWFDRLGREVGSLGRAGLGSVLALSPDGTRVARSVTEEGSAVAGIWLLDLATQSASRLTFNRWNDIYPVWSPDGRVIAFSSDRSGSYNLFTKAADGSGEETALLPSPLWHFPESWARGGLLAFTRRDPQTRADVWAFDPNDGGPAPRPLVRTDADELQARFSPDGRFIAYVSDESGRSEVYVQAVPPTGAKWQVSAGGGYQPQWRGDGRELYYLAPDLQLMAVPAQAREGSFAPGPPQPLFAARIRRSILRGASPYVAALDGERFLVDTSSGAELSSPIHLLLGEGRP